MCCVTLEQKVLVYATEEFSCTLPLGWPFRVLDEKIAMLFLNFFVLKYKGLHPRNIIIIIISNTTTKRISWHSIARRGAMSGKRGDGVCVGGQGRGPRPHLVEIQASDFICPLQWLAYMSLLNCRGPRLKQLCYSACDHLQPAT